MVEKIISTFPMHPASEARIRDVANLVNASAPSDSAIIQEGNGAIGIIARGPARIGATIFDGLPSLTFAFAYGSGSDCFDLAAATERGIPVINNAGVAPTPVAEYTIGSMVMMLRAFPEADRFLRSGGNWDQRLSLGGRGASGLTLGVVGFGNIGREVARRARLGLDMQVIAFDELIDKRVFADAQVQQVGLQELLQQSDVVTLHVPLLPTTHKLIGRTELNSMKEGAVLVNASRGPVVDEEALVEALTTRRLRGAAIDVFDPEPPNKLNPLFTLSNVLVTPHIAGVTDDVLERMSMATADNVRMALAGKRPRSVVNPEAWPPRTLNRR